MKLISLTKGKSTIVDDDVYEWASKRKWYYHSSGYAHNSKLGYLHRLILNRDNAGGPVDHVDGDKLNNVRTNLRRASVSQNAMNKKVRYDSVSQYKGVEYRRDVKRKKPYRARIQVKNCCYITIGHFETAEQAAEAYNEVALKYYGEFAKLNEVIK